MAMNNGYSVEREGVHYLEYHVDDTRNGYSLDELAGCTKFGAKLSFWNDPNECPIMMWGQDEVVSHEKQQSSMTWFGSEGQAPTRPKQRQGHWVSYIWDQELRGWLDALHLSNRAR